jgi:FixJ family two-component response regulator
MGFGSANDRTSACVCIVDDDAAVRRAIANLLEAGGYRPIGFDAGETLLSWARLARIDVAIFDVKLRGMNGFELQERFAAYGLDIPFIFISGHCDAEKEDRALQVGALALLRKPVDPDELFEHIERALRQRRSPASTLIQPQREETP